MPVKDARRWVDHGTDLFMRSAAGLDNNDVRADSSLPGWTVGQLVGHVAANADALCNLAQWAATGIETPMYASVEARETALEKARSSDADDLLSWLAGSADDLERCLDKLTENMWAAEVRTIRGRVLPATAIPWLRAREVCVHAVDLAQTVTFAELPHDFLAALTYEASTKRGLGARDLPDGDSAEIAAWITGRPHGLRSVPVLGPWL